MKTQSLPDKYPAGFVLIGSPELLQELSITLYPLLLLS
jgi:hypothetical protein